MFYLCSIGSNLDPAQHVSQAVGELLARFGQLRLSSVIQTKPVGMQSHHDFLNCLFIVESELSQAQLKAEFVTMELTHGRDRGNPLCKVVDRPLDIDILASSEQPDFAHSQVDAYLRGLLAECYGQGQVRDRKVALRLHTSKVFAAPLFGLTPVDLRQHADNRQTVTPVQPAADPRHLDLPRQ
ncbi:2-amino-4-hydroxy-6-hydroxymethyldihydropteridine diphosphokinase [Aeromonas tecta]|uniref:2-amino-4-hydroxy-6- hydroxymethyldihydropteridine diphosphokinase n=1 Tax=Aeromonas tecta TaxID=324617 RepID=UPI000680F66A|nr:2-amino-4-hydroxy-6-hydroxymethyldihydropteridine diphosphokinase [Aeromonas tecta]